MSDKKIIINQTGNNNMECSSVILVPDEALKNNGHIKFLSIDENTSNKHEFHAMSQIAHVQLMDNELDINEQSSPLEIIVQDEHKTMDSGLAVCRTTKGEIKVITNTKELHKSLLQAAYKYCTRWIRLDI